MKLRKLLNSITIMISITLLGCSTLKSDVVDMDGLKVAYVVKSGGLNDKSVGQLGYEGLLRAQEELGAKISTLEGDINKPEEFEKEIKKIAEKNELIIMNGTDLAKLSVEVSAMYRNKKIVIIGAKENETNIQDVTFKDEEGAFLMGIIAGMNTKSNKIGFIALEDNESTERLLSGFISGIKKVNEIAAESLSIGDGTVYITKEATEERAYSATEELIENGVDIIFEKLSTEEVGVFKAAQENSIKIIGVATDKYKYYPEYKGVILSSMEKKIDEVVYDVIVKTKEGEFKSGEQNMDMEDLEGGKLDYSSSSYMTNSDEVMEEVNKYKEEIINKKIIVPTNHLEVLEFGH